IQSGDSGGPLVSSSGQVVGMDTAASTGYQLGPRGQRGQGQSGQTAGGTGFAIPINQALAIGKQIEAGTASDTVHIGGSAFLGVSVADANSGATVQQLVSGGPAGQAGLARGDVITAINARAVDSATTLTRIMDSLHPGDKAEL